MHHRITQVRHRFYILTCLIASMFTLVNCGGSDDNTEPPNKSATIENVAPGENTLVKDGNTILLSADVTDDFGVAKVEFLIDGIVVGQAIATPYEVEWTPSESGHYILSVRATDTDGATTNSGVMNFTAVGFSCTEEQTCDAFVAKEAAQVVIAFYPSWKISQYPVNDIPFNKLTHVIYSFAVPVEHGELNTSDVDGEIDNLVTKAHAAGVKVFFSIGGAGSSDPFAGIAVKERDRALFVDRVKCYIKNHCLDGVDIDWEHWNGTDNTIAAESNGLVSLLTDLRSTLDNDIEISTDVFASNWFGKHYYDGIVSQVTYINTMLYDLRGPWSEEGPHSSYAELITDGTSTSSIESWGLKYWNGYRDWPVEKTVIGMPFYGRDFAVNNGDIVDYNTIVTRVQAASGDLNADKFQRTYYDGPTTAAKKAAYARDNGYAGVMFWELTGDTKAESTSLLEAIHNELND